MFHLTIAQPASVPKGLVQWLLVLTLAGPLTAVQAEPISGVVPLSPQPSTDAIKPGLAVEYLNQKFYTLDEIYQADKAPVPGEPIAMLNQLTETDPVTKEDKIINVLTSDRSMMVGAFIRGMIHFQESGNWILHLVSNDGVRFWVGGVQIWEDPEIHFDRESDPLELVIPEPGWYEFKLDYYQKKGSHALQLLWTPPGGVTTVVPAEALAHLQ